MDREFAGGENDPIFGLEDWDQDLAPFDPSDRYPSSGEYSSFHDVDTSAEVDAAFRSQRRIAVGHFAVFAIAIVGLGLSILLSDWAIGDRVLGGFSPSFLLAAVGLYAMFVAIAVAGASLANGVDNKMLGASSLPRAGNRSDRGLVGRLLRRGR
jgi:hypothetical protein